MAGIIDAMKCAKLYRIDLSSPPFDSISGVHFFPTNPDHFLVSAWDTIRLDNGIQELDLPTVKVTYLGQHGNVVTVVNYARGRSALLFDLSLEILDPCSSSANVSTHVLPERVYHPDPASNTLVVSMSSRLFRIYDIRRISEPSQTRESSLKFMIRSLACMSNRKGYAIGSVEGRTGEGYFDPSPEVWDQKYALKCHRQTIEDIDHIHNTFASAGSDETVSIWDHKLKMRLRQYPKYSGPIASVAFSCDGSRLAVVVSYTLDEDDGEEASITVEAYYMFIVRW
ncbi:WD40 repeat-like protein [Pisolithus thermaeus]|nr:WD40 repeat-like protein [Pisolithus thermaeus]